MADKAENAGVSETPNSPQRLTIDQFLKIGAVSPLPYPERKDGWITKVALGVILLSAIISSIALIWPVFWPFCAEQEPVVCAPRETPEWAAEMLRLSLVASLAFVMGTGGPNTGNNN